MRKNTPPVTRKRRPMLVWLTMVSAFQPRGLPQTSLNWSCNWSGSVLGAPSL